jgi:hypothetical protein
LVLPVSHFGEEEYSQNPDRFATGQELFSMIRRDRLVKGHDCLWAAPSGVCV